MVTFHSLIISIFPLILLLTSIDASRYQSVRQKRADACPNPNNNACLFVTCENGGQCFEDPTTLDCFKCQCAPGYAGKVCDTPVAILPTGCNPGCQNSGLCNGNVCVCPAGYTGIVCQTRDYCLPINPCQNGGQCTSTGTNYVCDCTGTGYTGTVCSVVIPTNLCAPNPCLNGGQCSTDGTTANCLCVNDYIGVFCQIAPVPCAKTPCENGGKCELLATNTYGCVCPAQFTGTRCETSIFENHPCVTMPASVCLNGGVCTVNQADYLCKCAAGWSGRNCQTQITSSSCDPDPCGVHGSCVLATSITGTIVYCNCENLWTGRYCDVNMNVDCPVGYCVTGICRMNGNVPYCQCPASYTGERCDIFIDTLTTPILPITTPIPIITTPPVENTCNTSPCLNGGTCYGNSDTYRCECLAPWSGPTCDDLTVTPVTEEPITTPVPMACEDQPCQNGGVCVPVGTSYSCFCGLTSIYTGKNCDSTTPMTIDECPLDCTPGSCIFSGNPAKPYACLWNGVMRPTDGTTG